MVEGVLIVHVVRAHRLMNRDGGVTRSDPYVIVKYFGNEIARTLTIKDNDCPEWNYSTQFIICGEFPSDESNDVEQQQTQISFEVWDSDPFSKDDFLGCVQFPLQSVVGNHAQNIEGVFDLQQRSESNSKPIHGDITLSIHFQNNPTPNPYQQYMKLDLNPNQTQSPWFAQ
uniref:C2 domain-containing protein n=1 Tax=Timspurckia oligopyrenoides TaxID=708627 RepID=A0A7S0ZIT1_9RHOD|mmetsp:Transcript_6942/g.12435  ORF Transcript_6942/g.12435 Transcript_6942/m.12435 type:complete len:171 (+) Transcript_6942:1387-1899(+)